MKRSRGLPMNPVSAETWRSMRLTWARWRDAIDADLAAAAASDAPLLTSPDGRGAVGWHLPVPDPEDPQRLEPCAWRERRAWCTCFRCGPLNAVHVSARELAVGRPGLALALAPEHAAEAARLAATRPKWLTRGKARRRERRDG